MGYEKCRKKLCIGSLLLVLALMIGGCKKNTSTGELDQTVTKENVTQVQEEGNEDMKVVPSKVTNLTAFNLKDVIVTDDYYQNSLKLEVAYLLSLDEERLLAGFRETAGLDTAGINRYDGWENSLIGGHTLGHYLTAVSQAYVNDAVSKEDKEALYKKITSIVDGLLECQNHSKGKSGFIFGATVINSDNVEQQFDYVEENKTNISTQAWVPWYTMHKIIAGLTDTYNLTGYEPAKTVVSSLADWVYNRTQTWSELTRQTVLRIEYGGMNDCLYDVYQITGEETHALAAHQFDEETLFEKVYSDTNNALNNLHANTTIPKFLGALKRYQVLGESESSYLKYAQSFWDMVVNKHTYITGGNSEWEHFGEDYVLDAERTNSNCETCNTYNMLKLSKALYEITGEVKYVDYYESTLINAILSSQNPETGMTMYFQPMASGYFKVYGSRYDHFWCCTGSGMENFTKLNDGIYYHTDEVLTINRYVSSEVTWEEKNLLLTQKADIPNSSDVEFLVTSLNGAQTVDVELRLRVPDYAAGNVTVKINGTEYDATLVDSYLVIEGPINHGTIIEVHIPMEVRAYNLPDNENVYAFKYGPVVLSAELGEEGMTTGTTGVNVTIPTTKNIAFTSIALAEGFDSVSDFMKNCNDHLVKADDSLTFTLKDTNQSLTFTPHYRQYTKRYGIYLEFQTVEEEKEANSVDEAAKKERLLEAKLDTVQPGYGQYENDALHNMVESDSVGSTNEGTSRFAKAGGYFTYHMVVAEEGPTYLKATLKKSDNGKSLYIAAGELDGSEVVIQQLLLDYSGEEEYYDITVVIPEAVISQKKQTLKTDEGKKMILPITFQGAAKEDSAAVCNFLYTYRSLADDSSLVYFVDCGDVGVTTVSDGDSFGTHNSVTDQVYQVDSLTGYSWGIVDEAEDTQGGSAKSTAVFTANTWSYEFITEDGFPKTETNRYTKNQFESGVETRYLDYAFELENGTYEVEVGFCDPWGCSASPSIYANLGKENEVVIAENNEVKDQPVVTANVSVTDGVLTVNVRGVGDRNLAINMTYIIIREVK